MQFSATTESRCLPCISSLLRGASLPFSRLPFTAGKDENRSYNVALRGPLCGQVATPQRLFGTGTFTPLPCRLAATLDDLAHARYVAKQSFPVIRVFFNAAAQTLCNISQGAGVVDAGRAATRAPSEFTILVAVSMLFWFLMWPAVRRLFRLLCTPCTMPVTDG